MYRITIGYEDDEERIEYYEAQNKNEIIEILTAHIGYTTGDSVEVQKRAYRTAEGEYRWLRLPWSGHKRKRVEGGWDD